MLTAMSTAAVASHHQDGEDRRQGSHKGGGLFKQADLDRDGSISEAEHEAAITKQADERRGRFAEMDADGDGVVTKEEAKTARKARHEKSKSAVSGE